MQSCDLTNCGALINAWTTPRAAELLAYTDTLGLSTLEAKSQRGHVRLPKQAQPNLNDDKMMA